MPKDQPGDSSSEAGENKAAQLHAEAALEGCYAGHWDRWGLKPGHRYTLAGGTGADAENVSGYDTCTKRGDGYRRLGSLDYEIRDAVNGLMESRGHRKRYSTRPIPF